MKEHGGSTSVRVTILAMRTSLSHLNKPEH